MSTNVNTAIGISMTITGGIIQSFGFVAQKVAHNKVNILNDNVAKDDQKSVLSQWIWWVGISTYMLGATSNSFALNFAAQSIIAPLGALDLATNTILSYFILKESITRKDILAMIIIIIGAVFVVLFGPIIENDDITIDEFRKYYEAVPFIVSISLFTVISVILFFASKYAERKNFENDKNDEIIYGRNFLLFSWVWIAAFFGSTNVLFVKSMVTMITSSFSSSNAFKTNATDYLTYIILVLWILCLVLMEFHKQKALSHFGALYVVPIFEVIALILTAFIGMIYFQEYAQFTAVSGSLFTLGIIITLIGIVILSYDIGKLLSELYDEYIKVAFIEYDQCEYKYTKTIIYGGIFGEYFQQRNLRKPPICYNANVNNLRDKIEMNVNNKEP